MGEKRFNENALSTQRPIRNRSTGMFLNKTHIVFYCRTQTDFHNMLWRQAVDILVVHCVHGIFVVKEMLGITKTV